MTVHLNKNQAEQIKEKLFGIFLDLSQKTETHKDVETLLSITNTLAYMFPWQEQKFESSAETIQTATETQALSTKD